LISNLKFSELDRKGKIKEVLEWILCIVIAIVLALTIRFFIGTPTVVNSTSMYPTLIEGQRLILNKLPATLNEMPKRGDIITFEAPTNKEARNLKANYDNEPENIWSKFTYYVLEIDKKSYIKRVIALEGEHVKIENGKIYINGEELEENYLQEGVYTQQHNTLLADFTVPEGYIFAIGDNREDSFDCRNFGCIPLEKIESKVWIRFWPFNLFGNIE